MVQLNFQTIETGRTYDLLDHRRILKTGLEAKAAGMNWEGIIIGAAAFIIIGIFHPIVIKSEYHFSKRIWPIFLLLGLVCLALSTQLESTYAAAVAGILGFASLWSIHEIIEQEERVRKGWFPANPNRGQPADKPEYKR